MGLSLTLGLCHFERWGGFFVYLARLIIIDSIFEVPKTETIVASSLTFSKRHIAAIHVSTRQYPKDPQIEPVSCLAAYPLNQKKHPHP